jgi:hypothetical protein
MTRRLEIEVRGVIQHVISRRTTRRSFFEDDRGKGGIAHANVTD